MKWFKHDTDAFFSEGADALIDFDGFAAYGRWCRLLEIVACKMDETDKCHVEYSISKWCLLLGLKQKKLSLFLKLTENKLKTKVVVSENKIKIEIPNLLIKQDNHSNNLQVTCKSLASKIKNKNKNKIKNKDKEPPISPKGEKVLAASSASDKNSGEGHNEAGHDHSKKGVEPPKPEVKPAKQQLLDRFDRFWSAYPKKMSKGKTEKVWLKLKPNEQLLSQILAAIERATTSFEWTKENGQFIKYPSTWLNARGWEDVHIPEASTPTGFDALKALREEEGRG